MQKVEWDGKISCTDSKLLNWVLEMLENKGIEIVKVWDGDVTHEVEIMRKVQWNDSFMEADNIWRN